MYAERESAVQVFVETVNIQRRTLIHSQRTDRSGQGDLLKSSLGQQSPGQPATTNVPAVGVTPHYFVRFIKILLLITVADC